MGGRGDRSACVAARKGVVVLNARARFQGVGHGDGRRLLLDVDLRHAGCAPRLIAVPRDDGEQRLAMEHYLPVGEERFIGENRGDVVLAGNVRRRQNCDHARGGSHRGEIKAPQIARGFVSHANGDMQRPVRLADVVDIGRRALHVQAGRIMRQRLVNNRGRRNQFRDIIRRHGALQFGLVRSRRKFQSAPFRQGWRRPPCDSLRSRAGRSEAQSPTTARRARRASSPADRDSRRPALFLRSQRVSASPPCRQRRSARPRCACRPGRDE